MTKEKRLAGGGAAAALSSACENQQYRTHDDFIDSDLCPEEHLNDLEAVLEMELDLHQLSLDNQTQPLVELEATLDNSKAVSLEALVRDHAMS